MFEIVFASRFMGNTLVESLPYREATLTEGLYELDEESQSNSGNLPKP